MRNVSKNDVIQIKAELTNVTQDSTRLIAEAAKDACKEISQAAADAKLVLAADKIQASKSDNNNFSGFLYKQVSFGLSIIAVVLGGFIYLTNPSTDNNTALQLQDQRITAQQQTIDELTKVQQNDTQEVKASVRDLVQKVNDNNLAIERLSTIIQERLPKNQNLK